MRMALKRREYKQPIGFYTAKRVLGGARLLTSRPFQKNPAREDARPTQIGFGQQVFEMLPQTPIGISVLSSAFRRAGRKRQSPTA